jgi:hypothetical protein
MSKWHEEESSQTVAHTKQNVNNDVQMIKERSSQCIPDLVMSK